MNIAVIGGGINGLCISWEAAKQGATVTLLEKNEIMRSTSSASTKLLHGGIRYLEKMELGLVRESLRERNWWLENVPELTHPIEILIPVQRDSQRSLVKYKVGLVLYDLLAGSARLQHHLWIGKKTFLAENPELKNEGLIGGFAFFDGMMNDYKLGCWVAQQAVTHGVEIVEQTEVTKVVTDGWIYFINKNTPLDENNPSHKELIRQKYDIVINATGSLAENLLTQSQIQQKYNLDHIRGSHILVNRTTKKAYLLEVPGEKRIFFVLPYEGHTIVGTTEVRQSINDRIVCSQEEKYYLISAYNHYFSRPIKSSDVVHEFAGLRPLIKSKRNPSDISREYALTLNNRLLTVYGGKWTTARSLARKVCREIGLRN